MVTTRNSQNSLCQGLPAQYALCTWASTGGAALKWRDEQEPADRSRRSSWSGRRSRWPEPGRRLTFTPGLVAGVLSVVVLLFAAYVGIQLLTALLAGALLTVGRP